MLKLYDIPLSPYAQKCKIALCEKGIEFETVTPEVLTGKSAPEFLAANPRAEVPALIDGDFAVFQSSIILDYLEERWPEPPLVAADPRARARSRMIEEVCSTQYDAVNWGIMEVRAFQRAEGALAETLLRRADEQTRGLMGWLTHQLGGRDWLEGERFGRADLAAYPFVSASILLGTTLPAGDPIAAWHARCAERPSCANASAAAADWAAQTLAVLPGMLASGALRREYRDHRLEWMIRSGGLEVVVKGLEAGNIRFSHEIGI